MYSLLRVFIGCSLPKLYQVSDPVCGIHGEDFKEQGEESVQFGNVRFWHAPGRFAARMRVSNTTSEAMKLCGNTVNLLPPAWESVTARSKRS